ncbi:hypothetical protein K502DRAFT_11551 [Neoconidiobolus thromboides FSU 785]|nr:hypothetical protein K502DRAFT_11551 [Neoconidiobolus thromboides FSU 785]
MLIPKNTSVYVRRVPAKPGGTNAMYYISDDPQNALQAKTGEVHADLSSYGNKGNNYNDEDDNNPAFGDITLSMDGVIPGENEEEKLQALFDQTSTQWRQQNAHMGGHQGSYRGGQNYSAQRNQNQFNKPISANYVCHKCGIKGHYVQNCPSQVDRKNMQPRVKKTTGIPRSFLKNVEQVPDGKGAMVASDGTLVIAQANSTAWEKIRMNQRASGFSFEELRETAPIVNELQCKVCQKLLVNAVSVPCCRTLFCLDCITEALINPDPEKHFKCPSCNKVGIVPDNLIAEHSVRADVGEHLRKWAKDRLGDNGSEHEMDKPNPIAEESNDIQDDIQPHIEHNPRQIITVADSRDNHVDYSNRSNDYSNRNNDYSNRNNDYSNRNNDYNSRNNDYNPRNRNQQREGKFFVNFNNL